MGNVVNYHKKQAFPVTELLFIFHSDYSMSCYKWQVLVAIQRWLITHGLRTNRVHDLKYSSSGPW